MAEISRTTQRPFVLASILLAMFMVAIEATIVATAMPDIVARLGGFAYYSWVFAAFLLAQTATTVLFGKFADLYGRRPVLIWGIVVFLIGSILCGLAWSMPSLIAFRLIQGIGAGSILPTATTVVGDLYTPQERPSVQGYLSSVWGISAVIGPFAGGIIVERFSWPWVFWINIPIGIATIVLLLAFLHEGIEKKKHSMDFLGSFLFATAISSLLIMLTLVSQNGSSAERATEVPAYSQPWLFGVIFLATIPLFFWQERRAKEPMLELDLWKQPVIASANGAVLVAGMTLMGITSFLAIYVQGVMGRSATIAGLTLTMMAVGWPAAASLSSRFYRWIGMRNTLRLGTTLMTAGTAVFLLLTPSSSPILAGLGSMITGFGMGLLNITVILLVQGSVGWAKRGSATASNIFSRNLGSTFGATVLGAILNVGLQAYPGASPERIRRLLDNPGSAADASMRNALHHGLHLTFWCVVGLAFLTVVVALFIPARTLAELTGGTDAAGVVNEA